MKIKINYPCLLMLGILSIFSSCKKDATTSSATKTTSTSTLTASTLATYRAIALASVDSAGTKDSIYMVNCFPPNGKIDSVAFNALPSAIGTYLTANYSGYTFTKAYKIDSASVVVGYVVVIKYNNLFVGLKFTSTGTFVNVLEQKDGANMGGGGKGWHPGGPFSDRGGVQQDTLAISAIPTTVLTYFTTTYPTDTLLHAYKTPDTTYILISKDSVLYATNISATGSLIKRVKLEPQGGKHVELTAANLLPAITTYLTATYPGYVFDKAYSEIGKSGVIGYHVFITVNSTNYEVGFDATGTFVKAIVIH